MAYVSKQLRDLVRERARACCEYCLIHVDDSFLGCEADHIIGEKHGEIILYFDRLSPNRSVEFTFKLRAKYPVRAKTFASRVYEYYNPTIEDTVQPAEFVVKAK